MRTSVYAVTEADPPDWKPGEESAAVAFIGIALWLILDTLFSVVRVFKKKKGLYFWSITLGLVGLFLDAIGVILKYLTPNTKHLWILYSFLLLNGWAVYAPAQLVVLYSRLHLVNDVVWLRKVVFYLILSTYLTFILPTWVCNWHSYNPDPKVTSLWSPRTAIVERYTQTGFTLLELLISGTYVWSLLRILRGKVTIRQRRVMLDLVYVNILAVSFDVLTIIFVDLNQLGISHPLQTLSYAIKFKLEFVVLNQLMAVAARGVQRRSWQEKRYFNANIPDTFSAEARRWADQTPASQQHHETENVDPLDCPPDYSKDEPNGDRLSVPPPAATYPNRGSSIANTATSSSDNSRSHPDSNTLPQELNLNLRTSLIEPEFEQAQETQDIAPQTSRTSEAFSGSTLFPPAHEPREESPHLFPRQLHKRKRRTMEIIREHVGRGARRDVPSEDKDRVLGPRPSQQRSHLNFNPNEPQNATLRRPNPRKRSVDDDEDEEEEIGVHMWERKGAFILCAPWMEKEEAQAERERQDV